jgi:hypothetical protein
MSLFLRSTCVAMLITGLSGVVSSCKPPKSDSSLKTLDNFAAGRRVKTNVCSGDPAVSKDTGLDLVLTALKGRISWETKGDKNAMEQAALKAFAAVPADVQGLFLGLGGRIIITDKANSICTDSERQMTDVIKDQLKKEELKALSEDLNSVTACYLFAPPSIYKEETGVNGQLVAVVLSANVSEIQHSLVRSIGYMVSHVFSKLVVTEDDGQVAWMSADNPSAEALKQQVADGFLKDVSNSSFASRFAKYQKDGQASNSEKRWFNNFVFAEAFDSFYCNVHSNDDKNTLKTMIASFPSTYSAFSGHQINGSVVNKKSDAFGTTSERMISLGAISDPPQIPFSEKLVLVDWMKETIDGVKNKGSESKEPVSNSAFALVEEPDEADGDTGLSLAGGRGNSSGGFTGWFNNWVTKPVSETVTGVGVLYNDYSKTRDQGIQRRMDQYTAQNGGRPPSFGQQMMAAVGGVSDGSGYSRYYNNTQQAFQQRERQGQSTLQAFGGSLSDTTGYTNVYNRIAQRTDNIAKTVIQDDPNWNKYSTARRLLNTTSVAFNGAIPELERVPVVGDFVKTARLGAQSISGGAFTDSGGATSRTTWQRVTDGAQSIKGIADLSGLTKAATGWASGKVFTGVADRVSSVATSTSKWAPVAKQVSNGMAIGEHVYNSYNKTYKNWTGPGTIVGNITSAFGAAKKVNSAIGVLTVPSPSTTTTRPSGTVGGGAGGGGGRGW